MPFFPAKLHTPARDSENVVKCIISKVQRGISWDRTKMPMIYFKLFVAIFVAILFEFCQETILVSNDSAFWVWFSPFMRGGGLLESKSHTIMSFWPFLCSWTTKRHKIKLPFCFFSVIFFVEFRGVFLHHVPCCCFPPRVNCFLLSFRPQVGDHKRGQLLWGGWTVQQSPIGNPHSVMHDCETFFLNK